MGPRFRQLTTMIKPSAGQEGYSHCNGHGALPPHSLPEHQLKNLYLTVEFNLRDNGYTEQLCNAQTGDSEGPVLLSCLPYFTGIRITTGKWIKNGDYAV